MAPKRHEFLGLHCGESDGQGANRCAAALAAISLLGHPRLGSRLRDILEMRMYRRSRRTGNLDASR